MSEISEEIVHVNGTPHRVVVFLHGYIDCNEALDRTISGFVSKLDDCAVHLPQAPVPCEIHERKRQWYSMHQFDPDDARKFVPTMRECTKIYNHMAPGFAESFAYLNPYLNRVSARYGLSGKELYLCGFSQGAMLALYAALMHEKPVAGCVSFSGIMAPYTYLCRHYRNSPPVLLIHGDADNLVRFEAMDFTRKKLEKIGCSVSSYVVNGGQHRITEDGLERALDFINGKRL